MTSSIPEVIRNALTADIGERMDFSFTGGGCINNGGRLRTPDGDYYLKWNDARKFPGMFDAEEKGLALLRHPGVIRIPGVTMVKEADAYQFILLEYIHERDKHGAYWQLLGERLGALHRCTNTHFGLDHPNYIGSLPQRNLPSPDWVEFFVRQRIDPQLKVAVDHGRLPPALIRKFEILYRQLPGLLPAEPPSLLHGDLWSGNLITDDQGEPCLIDPAVYYGHREAEIAFTMLFGGFPPVFYDSYHQNFPLSPGFGSRAEVYNLYPLLVHTNLFGGGYAAQVVSLVNRFV